MRRNFNFESSQNTYTYLFPSSARPSEATLAQDVSYLSQFFAEVPSEQIMQTLQECNFVRENAYEKLMQSEYAKYKQKLQQGAASLRSANSTPSVKRTKRKRADFQ